MSLDLFTYYIPFLKYTQYLLPKAWQAVYYLLPINFTPNSVSIIRLIWPQSLYLFGPIAANPAADCDHHLPQAVGVYITVILPQGAQAHSKQTGLARQARANPVAARAGGGRAGSGKGARAGVKAEAEVEAGVKTGAEARASNSNSNSGSSL